MGSVIAVDFVVFSFFFPRASEFLLIKKKERKKEKRKETKSSTRVGENLSLSLLLLLERTYTLR